MKRERLERARSIKGWMTDPELDWLHDNAAGKLVIEFGSWLGRSTAALLSAKTLVCVDHWLGSSEHQATIDKNGLKPFEEFTGQFEAEIKSGPLVIHRGTLRSRAFCLRLAATYGTQADLVFIDASHALEHVREDIQLAEVLLKPDGILAGHDYGHKQYRDVQTVVDEYGTPSLVETIWWFGRQE